LLQKKFGFLLAMISSSCFEFSRKARCHSVFVVKYLDSQQPVVQQK
jgi:hypothetical protein